MEYLSIMGLDCGNLDGSDDKKDKTFKRSKSRYSEAYLRAICAQGGCTMHPPELDEDVDAIDAWVNFARGQIGVQIKATSKDMKLHSDTVSVSVKNSWLQKWKRKYVPVILLQVFVPEKREDWIEYEFINGNKQGIFHNVSAYWMRVDNLPECDNRNSFTIHIPKENSMSVTSLGEWDEICERKIEELGKNG